MALDYIDGECTFDELGKYREASGYINLDFLNIKFDVNSREIIGNPNRDKNWIDFKGTHVLLKENLDSTELSVYAELITTTLARQVGLESAEIDLAEYDNKRGILSKSIVKEDEELFSLQSLIGDTKTIEDYPDITDMVEMFKKLITFLKNEGLSKEEIKRIIVDLQKQLTFGIFVGATDIHTENISLIKNKNTGRMSISPIYDVENSLMLDMPEDLLEDLNKNIVNMAEAVDILDPKISIIPEDGNLSTSLWKLTLDQMSQDDEVYDFMMDCYEELDIEGVIKEVETKIGCELPDIVKKTATKVINIRKQEINKIMINGYEGEELT